MSTQEGTIQFAYELQAESETTMAADLFADLAAWRSILFDLNLIGQSPTRYNGFAYGNLSLSNPAALTDPFNFFITASQTSGAKALLPDDLVRITHCNLERFWVDAKGSLPPSSETLTHAMIYIADPKLQCVLHVHSPVLWHHRAALRLPETDADVGYGSADMCLAVAQLMDQFQSRPLAFATAGHEDGIFACGHNLRDAGGLLISYLAKARALNLMQPAPIR